MVTNESVRKNKFYSFSENFFRHQKGYYILLTLISLCFVAIKLAMPIMFNGSFIDEYLHSVGGNYLFTHHHFPKYYIDQASYSRGSYVTALSGLFTYLFGRSLFSFKLVPIAMGIINFSLLLLLAHKTLQKKSYVVLLSIIYSISPWVIFNHFYLRMYVFYEFFLLLNLIIAQMLLAFCEQNKKRHFFVGTLFFLFLCAAQLQLSNDNGVYMPILAGGIALAYIFIACSHLLQFKKNTILSYIFHSNIFTKLTVLLTLITAAYLLFSGHEKILFLFKAKLQWTSSEKLKYQHFFFEKNIIPTSFFLLSMLSVFSFKNKKKQMVAIIGGALFSIHLCSSSDLQITRGIFYFLPLYYLLSLVSIDKITYFSEKIFYIAIFSGFTYTIVLNYPIYFTKIPYIPSEIYYIDYSKTYSTVHQYCSGKTIIEASPTPFIASYYDVKVDYVLSETGWIEKETTYYYDEKERLFRTVFNNTPVLANFNTLNDKNDGVCLIVRKQSKERFVSEKTLRLLSQNQGPLQFINIELYISPKPTPTLKSETL